MSDLLLACTFPTGFEAIIFTVVLFCISVGPFIVIGLALAAATRCVVRRL